jgi:hypothetical protein
MGESYSRARWRALADVTAAIGAGGKGVGGSSHGKESSEYGEALHYDNV